MIVEQRNSYDMHGSEQLRSSFNRGYASHQDVVVVMSRCGALLSSSFNVSKVIFKIHLNGSSLFACVKVVRVYRYPETADMRS